MNRGFLAPMAMGVVAGALAGVCLTGLTTERERSRLRRQAGKTVKDLLDRAQE